MKNIFKIGLIGIILIMISSAYAQNCSEVEGKLKGKVKSYSEIKYGAEKQNGKIVKTEKLDEEKVYHYNEKGDLIQYELYFNQNGKKVVSKESYFYDEKGNLIKTIKMKGEDVNIYNDKGQLIEKSEEYTSGRFKSRNTYKYDEKGNRVEQIEYDSKGIIKNKIQDEFDENGNIIKTRLYDADGILSLSFTFKYDESNKIETNYHYSDGSSRRIVNEFDSKGNKIKSYSYNSDNIIKSKYSYEYDDKGNMIQEVSYYENDEGEFIQDYIKTYKYDAMCNLIAFRKHEEGNIYGDDIYKSYHYDYDKQENWIKLVFDFNDISYYIIERKYTYYQ